MSLESFTREVRARLESTKVIHISLNEYDDDTESVPGVTFFGGHMMDSPNGTTEPYSNHNPDDLAKALAIIECMRDALMEITAECNSELAQVCPNEDCDYQSIGAVKCVNICDSTLAQASAIAEGREWLLFFRLRKKLGASE